MGQEASLVCCPVSRARRWDLQDHSPSPLGWEQGMDQVKTGLFWCSRRLPGGG